MSLGSPQAGTGFGGKGAASSSFLPSFLIGSSNATPTAARSLQSAVSPKNDQLRSDPQLVKPRFAVEKTETKSNVPPVNALNSLFSPKSPSSNNRSFAGSVKIVKSENVAVEKRDESALSPSQLDPFFQEGGEVSVDPTWITVFGFPCAAEPFILRQFRQYGVILQSQSQPSPANWIHIQYKTKLQARKALSKNGKILDGNIMIGVVLCVKEPVKSIQSPDRVSVLEPITNNLPGPNETRKSQNFGSRQSFGGISQNGTPNRTFSGMRRMTSLADTSQNVGSSSTPQKDTSVLGKTMSYIFPNW